MAELKTRALDSISQKLKQIKKDAIEARREVEQTRGAHGSGGNLNSRQQSGGSTG